MIIPVIMIPIVTINTLCIKIFKWLIKNLLLLYQASHLGITQTTPTHNQLHLILISPSYLLLPFYRVLLVLDIEENI